MKVPRLPARAFSVSNSAETNRLFLYEVSTVKPGHMRPIYGWKIVGYGKAPWPGSTDGFAAMFENKTNGKRIWQHYRERWIKK